MGQSKFNQYLDIKSMQYILKKIQKFPSQESVVYVTRQEWKPYKNTFKINSNNKYCWLALTKSGHLGFGITKIDAKKMAKSRSFNSFLRKKEIYGPNFDLE